MENTIDELSVHLLGRKTLIRSLNPREVAAGSLWLASSALGCTLGVAHLRDDLSWQGYNAILEVM